MSDNEPKDESESADSAPRAPEDRRHFLKVIGIGGLGAGLGVVIGAPAVATVGYPLVHRTVSGGDGFVAVGKRAQFSSGKPVKVDLFADKRDAWNRVEQVKVGSAWVIEQGGKLRAFTTVCPHLGCAVDLDDGGTEFKCPCHRSAFNLEGVVQEGPSPRDMDELELKEEGGVVAVKYVRFKQGISDKEIV